MPQHPVLLEAGVTGKGVTPKSRECGPGMDPNLGFKFLRQPPQSDESSLATGAAELPSFTRRGKKTCRNHPQVGKDLKRSSFPTFDGKRCLDEVT